MVIIFSFKNTNNRRKHVVFLRFLVGSSRTSTSGEFRHSWAKATRAFCSPDRSFILIVKAWLARPNVPRGRWIFPLHWDQRWPHGCLCRYRNPLRWTWPGKLKVTSERIGNWRDYWKPNRNKNVKSADIHCAILKLVAIAVVGTSMQKPSCIFRCRV